MGGEDEELAEHLDLIRQLSEPGGALATDSPHATIRNPDWFSLVAGRYRPRAGRAELHRRLRERTVDQQPHVRQERRAVILAGPPGAGKSTLLAEEFGIQAFEFLRIDADEFKVALLVEAMADGSYGIFLMPEELKASGHRSFPLELAALVHEESSMLAKALRREAIERGDNIIIDGVLSSESNALILGEELAEAGYTVEVIDVEVPYAISRERIAQRWRESYEAALRDGTGLGGRWVPSEYARDIFDGPTGASKCEAVARRLALECPAVNRYRLYRTFLGSDGAIRGPFLEQSLTFEEGEEAADSESSLQD